LISERFKAQFHLDDARISELMNLSEIKVFPKAYPILEQDQDCQWVGTIINGAVRTFVINENGDEISYLLQVNGDYIGDYESFLTNSKSTFNIKTCIDTEVLFFDKKGLLDLAKTDIFWLEFTKRMSDVSFLEAKRRIDELLLNSPEQRYLNLLQKAPEILQKIPQRFISTYLGITPQSLSRIRSRIQLDS